MRAAPLAMVSLALLAATYATGRAADAAAGEGEGSALDSFDLWGAIERQVDQHRTEGAMNSTNMQAFLSLIEYSEGTAVGGRDPYRTCYGYRHTVRDLRDHPAVTGEWRGESLASLGASYAGKVSTAAGRYQIIKPTWLACKRALGLKDFGPASQDAAAVYLITQRGALDDVRAGRIESALAKCAKEWASLPGAGYGQPERKLMALLDQYERAGGALA